MLPTFFLIGLIFVPLGGVLLWGSNQVSMIFALVTSVWWPRLEAMEYGERNYACCDDVDEGAVLSAIWSVDRAAAGALQISKETSGSSSEVFKGSSAPRSWRSVTW